VSRQLGSWLTWDVQQNMHTIRLLVISTLFLFATAICRADTDVANVVHLPPQRVPAGFVDLALKFDLTSGKMVEAKVSWVAPKFKKLGVRIGDRLTIVDGKPLVDWSRSDFDSYLDAGLIEGKSAAFTFVGSRWLVMDHTFTITLKKELNQALVPTAASVTPAANAPVAPAAAAAHL
jgi:hypothetical protein